MGDLGDLGDLGPEGPGGPGGPGSSGGPGCPGGLAGWWLGTGGGRDGALKCGGGGMKGAGRTGASPAAGEGGRGGRGVFLADSVLASNILDLLFTGGGAAAGRTGRGETHGRTSIKRTEDCTRQEVTRTVHGRVPLRGLWVGGVRR